MFFFCSLWLALCAASVFWQGTPKARLKFVAESLRAIGPLVLVLSHLFGFSHLFFEPIVMFLADVSTQSASLVAVLCDKSEMYETVLFDT